MLRTNFFSAEQVAAIVADYTNSGLKPVEVAVMALAARVTVNANGVTQDEIDGLRDHGMTDEEILDVILAAALRNFFSKALDALGAEPDDVYRQLEPELVDALAAGRPFK